MRWIGIPIALWLIVRWQFFVRALIFDKTCSGLQALEYSARLVRRLWWKTLFAVFIFDLLATVPGILVGFGLMTLGRTAVSFANTASSVLYALTIPLSVIAVTIMFLDRRGDPLTRYRAAMHERDARSAAAISDPEGQAGQRPIT